MAIQLKMDFGVTGVGQATQGIQSTTNALEQNTTKADNASASWMRLRDQEGKFATKEQAALINSLAQSRIAMDQTNASLTGLNNSMASAVTSEQAYAEAAAQLGFASSSTQSTTESLGASMAETANQFNEFKDAVVYIGTAFNDITKESSIENMIRSLDLLESVLNSFNIDALDSSLDYLQSKLKETLNVFSLMGVGEQGLVVWAVNNSTAIGVMLTLLDHQNIVVGIAAAAMGVAIGKAMGIDRAFMSAYNSSKVFELGLRDVSKRLNELTGTGMNLIIKSKIDTGDSLGKMEKQFSTIEKRARETIQAISQMFVNGLSLAMERFSTFGVQAFSLVGIHMRKIASEAKTFISTFSFGQAFSDIGISFSKAFNTSTIGIYTKALYELGQTLAVAIGYPIARTAEYIIKANQSFGTLQRSVKIVTDGMVMGFHASRLAVSDFKEALESNLGYARATKVQDMVVTIEAKLGDTWSKVSSDLSFKYVLSTIIKTFDDALKASFRTFSTIGTYAADVFSRVATEGNASFSSLGSSAATNILSLFDRISLSIKGMFGADTIEEASKFMAVFKQEAIANTVKAIGNLKAGASAASEIMRVAMNDSQAFSGMATKFFSETKGGILALGEGAHAMQVGFLSLGVVLSQFDSGILKTIGFIAILVSILTGGFVAAIQFALGFIGNALYKLGAVMEEKMVVWVDKFQKAQVAVVNFEFTIKAMEHTFGKAIAGSLDSWQGFVAEMSAKSVWDNTSLNKMVQEIVAVGSALKLTNYQQEMLGRLIVDQAKAGDDLFDTTVAFVQALNGMGQGVIKYGLHVTETAIAHSKLAKSLGRPLEAMNDYEKASMRLGVLLEQGSVQEGKAALQLNTMAGVMKMVEKETTNLGIAMGEQGFFTMAYYKIIATLISSFELIPDTLMKVAGSLWDLISILAKVTGSWISNALTMAGIMTAYSMLKYAVSEIIIVQTALNFLFSVTGAAVGANVIAVTSLSSVWVNLANILKGVALTSLVTMRTMLIESLLRFKALTVAIATNPIVWKFAAIAAAAYLVYRAFQNMEAKTGVFSKTWDRLGVAVENIGNAFKKTGETMSGTQKLMMIFNAVIASLIDSIELLVTLILNGLVSILLAFSYGLQKSTMELQQLLGVFGITIPTVDDTTKALGEFNDTIIDMVTILSGNAQQSVKDMYNGVDRLGVAYADTKGLGKSFEDGIKDINKTLALSNTELDKAKEKLEALSKEYLIASAKGQDFKAAILKKEELGAAKEVAAIEEKTASDDAGKAKAKVSMDDIDKELTRTNIDIEKKIQQFKDDTGSIELEKKVKVKVDAKDFQGAMNAELESNAEIVELKKTIESLAPFKTSSEEAMNGYEAASQQLLALQEKLKTEYMAQANEFGKEQVAAVADSEEKIAQLQKDSSAEIDVKYQKDIASLQETLDQKLISEEQYAKESLALSDKYAEDKRMNTLKVEKDTLEQAAELDKLANGKDGNNPQREMEIKQKELAIKFPNIDDKVAQAIEEKNMRDRDYKQIQQDLDKFMGEMERTLSTKLPKMEMPVETIAALSELAKAYYQTSTDVEGAEIQTKKADADFQQAIGNYADKVKQWAKELRDEGKITDAEQLKKDYQEYEAFISGTVMPGWKDIADKVVAQTKASMDKLEKGVEAGPDIQKKYTKPAIRSMEEVNEAIDVAEKKWKKFEEGTLNIFDTIDLNTVEGTMKATGELLKNFEKISPGAVLGQILQKAVEGNDAIAEYASNAKEKGGAEFTKGLDSGNIFKMGAGAGKMLVGGLLDSMKSFNVWVAIFEFFNKDEAEFKKKMIDKIQEFAKVFGRLAENIPTFVVSIVGNIPHIVANMMTGIVKLIGNIVAMIPVLLARLVTEMVKAFVDFPEMFGAMWKEMTRNVGQGFIEFTSSFASTFGGEMDKITRLIISTVSEAWLSVISYMKRTVTAGEFALDIADSVSNALITSSGYISKAIGKNATALLVGGVKGAVGTSEIIYGIVEKNNKKIIAGSLDVADAVATSFANQSESAAEWAYYTIVATTLVRTVQAAMYGSYTEAALTFASGMAQAGEVISAYQEGALKRQKELQDKASANSEKWMARETEQAQKAAEFKDMLFDSKRVGSAEFKVKSVDDSANLNVANYALASTAELKTISDDFAKKMQMPPEVKPMKLDMGSLGDAISFLNDIVSNLESALVVGSIALGIALFPLLGFGAVIIAIIGVIAGLIVAIVKYWDKIKEAMTKFFNMVGDFFADLGTSISDGAAKLWEYITSGEFLTDILSAFTAIGTWFNTNVIMPISKAFNAVVAWFSAVFSPVIDGIKTFFTTTISPALDKLGSSLLEAFTWFDTNVTQKIFGWFSDFDKTVIQPLLTAMGNKFKEIITGVGNAIADIFTKFDKNVIQPMLAPLALFGKMIKDAFNAVAGIVEKPLKAFVDGVKVPFIWIYDNIVKPLIDTIKAPGKAASKAGNWVSNTANKVGDTVASWFAHGGMVPALAHGGLVRQFAHGGTIYRAAEGMRVPGLAGGGDSYGRDTVQALLSPGEMVLPNSVTQDGNLMRDLSRLILGEPSRAPTQAATSISAPQNTTNNYTISVNVDGNARMTKDEVQKNLVPVILEAIKDSTSRGKQIVNQRGVFK